MKRVAGRFAFLVVAGGILTLIVLLLANPVWVASAERTAKILVLYSWHEGMPWQVQVERGLRRGLEKAGIPFELYVEYLDAGRFPDDRYKDLLGRFLVEKYGKMPMDALVAESFPAASFLAERSSLLPNAERIFVYSWRKGKTPGKWSNIVRVEVDFEPAIAEVVRLVSPEVLYVVGDATSEHGKTRLEAFKKEIARKDWPFRIEYLVDLPLVYLLDSVSNLPRNAAVFYLPTFVYDDGKKFIPAAVARMVAEKANAPVFSHWKPIMGTGILGGYLMSGERAGETAAQNIGALILGGETEDTRSFYGIYYDWRQLKRWNIDMDRVPPEAEIMFYTPTLMEEYRWQIIATFAALAILILLSVFLILVDRKRKRLVVELRSANAELREFSWLSSHDLRESPRTVINYLQRLSGKYEDRLDETAKDYIGFAMNGARRLDAQIKGLHAYSQVSGFMGDLSEVDVKEVVVAVQDDLHASIAEAEATVLVDGKMPVVISDQTLLYLLFKNLIENALIYRRTNVVPIVWIATEVSGNQVTFSIRDNGIGIAPDYFDKIFVMFQRLHRFGEYPGTGIGLAICRKIIERHGGRIWVESELGKGSTFFFTLQAANRETAFIKAL